MSIAVNDPTSNDLERMQRVVLLRYGQIAIRVRWLVVGVGTLLLLVFKQQGWLGDSFGPMLVLAGFVAFYNTGLQAVLRRWIHVGSLPQLQRIHRYRRVSMVADLATFMPLLHFTGGVESPVFPLFLIAYIYLGIAGSIGETIVIGLSTYAAISGLALAEMWGWLDHHNIGPYDPGNRYREVGFVIANLVNWAVLLTTGSGLVRMIRMVLEEREARLERRHQQLAQARQFQIEILSHLPVGAVVFGAGGRVVLANDLARKLLNLDLDTHRSLYRQSAVEASGLIVYIERLLQGERIMLDDFPFVATAGGDKKWLRIIGVPPERDDRGILLIEDITEARAREQRERDMQERLAQADKFTSLGQMASGVAHELNNPLTAILSTAQYLQYVTRQGRVDPNEISDKAGHIVTHGHRIESLVKGLLSYAKPGRGQQAQRLDVAQTIDELMSFALQEIKRGNVTFEYDVPPDLPPFLGVKMELQQVILNLLTNARHAIGNAPGKITLSVRRVQDDDGHDFLRIVVSDNGPGIPPEVRDRIFEPFFTTKDSDRGTGLGLPIVLATVERYGGTVRVDSEPGQGATFIIDLPYLDTMPSWGASGEATFSPYQ